MPQAASIISSSAMNSRSLRALVSRYADMATPDIPNNNEGWGRVLLDDALYFDGDAIEFKIADETTGATSKQRVFAGGDIVTGAATVISAMGAGKSAAADIDRFLCGETVPEAEAEAAPEAEAKEAEESADEEKSE